MKLFADLYLDEDVDVLLAKLLNARGFDVTTARDELLLGQSDSSILAYAASHHWCVLTHNRSDFEELHRNYLSRKEDHAGILIAGGRNPYEIAQRVAILLNALTADEIANQMFYL